MSVETLDGIPQIAKHEAWSYETEVRLVATVNKLVFGPKMGEITAIRIPFSYSKEFVANRVFDSPIADSFGKYHNSLLRGTVEWDLCSNCAAKDPTR